MTGRIARLLLALSAVLACAAPALAADGPAIIPLPAAMQLGNGVYTLSNAVTVEAKTADERNVADFLKTFLAKRGITDVTTVATAAQPVIALSSTEHDAKLATEGYRLTVTASGVTIAANSGAGLFYGLQTFEQLFAPATSDGNTIRQLSIVDKPSYRWRGFMLDVSRHFFPVSFVERTIDLASAYKLNTFHWHLTDDQGWRIEIKRYPRLTTFASCGDYDHKLGTGPCNYYTQDQIRAIVAYAKRRYITVIPEIEMPGHSEAAATAYPELACKPIASDVYCPSEQTFTFLENVLAETMQLFPSVDIHTGGDEVPSKPWNASPVAQAVMQKYHLGDAHALQGWFDRRIEKYLEAHGRRMVGWDEILAGGVSHNAVVMSWRGTSGGIVAATRGNDVVMSPDPTLYFDHYQADRAWEPKAIGGAASTLHDVYDFDPGIDALTPEQGKRVLGAQANLWTEFIPTTQRAEYRMLPRLLALAELNWTPAGQKDWQSFVARTSPQYARFEADGLNFWIPGPTGLTDATTEKSSVTVTLTSPVPGAAMYYTTDGSYPTQSSTQYHSPIQLSLRPGEQIRVRVVTVLASGRVSTPAQATYARKWTAPAP
ncbi:MAG: beta-N-acetylhexosaminidase [Vulcanimicrobiaceae bacterium]